MAKETTPTNPPVKRIYDYDASSIRTLITIALIGLALILLIAKDVAEKIGNQCEILTK